VSAATARGTFGAMKKLLLLIALIGAVAAAAAAFRRDDVKKAATSATSSVSNMTQKGQNGKGQDSEGQDSVASGETVDKLGNGAADQQATAGSAPLETADVAGSATDLPGGAPTSN
jgi:hypothetical protein